MEHKSGTKPQSSPEKQPSAPERPTRFRKTSSENSPEPISKTLSETSPESISKKSEISPKSNSKTSVILDRNSLEKSVSEGQSPNRYSEGLSANKSLSSATYHDPTTPDHQKKSGLVVPSPESPSPRHPSIKKTRAPPPPLTPKPNIPIKTYVSLKVTSEKPIVTDDGGKAELKSEKKDKIVLENSVNNNDQNLRGSLKIDIKQESKNLPKPPPRIKKRKESSGSTSESEKSSPSVTSPTSPKSPDQFRIKSVESNKVSSPQRVSFETKGSSEIQNTKNVAKSVEAFDSKDENDSKDNSVIISTSLESEIFAALRSSSIFNDSDHLNTQSTLDSQVILSKTEEKPIFHNSDRDFKEISKISRFDNIDATAISKSHENKSHQENGYLSDKTRTDQLIEKGTNEAWNINVSPKSQTSAVQSNEKSQRIKTERITSPAREQKLIKQNRIVEPDNNDEDEVVTVIEETINVTYPDNPEIISRKESRTKQDKSREKSIFTESASRDQEPIKDAKSPVIMPELKLNFLDENIEIKVDNLSTDHSQRPTSSVQIVKTNDSKKSELQAVKTKSSKKTAAPPPPVDQEEVKSPSHVKSPNIEITTMDASVEAATSLPTVTTKAGRSQSPIKSSTNELSSFTTRDDRRSPSPMKSSVSEVTESEILISLPAITSEKRSSSSLKEDRSPSPTKTSSNEVTKIEVLMEQNLIPRWSSIPDNISIASTESGSSEPPPLPSTAPPLLPKATNMITAEEVKVEYNISQQQTPRAASEFNTNVQDDSAPVESQSKSLAEMRADFFGLEKLSPPKISEELTSSHDKLDVYLSDFEEKKDDQISLPSDDESGFSATFSPGEVLGKKKKNYTVLYCLFLFCSSVHFPFLQLFFTPYSFICLNNAAYLYLTLGIYIYLYKSCIFPLCIYVCGYFVPTLLTC